MACQKVAAGGVIVLGQIADPVLEDGFGRGERGGDEGQARTRGRYVADQGARAAKMKSAPGPGPRILPSDFPAHHPSHPSSHALGNMVQYACFPSRTLGHWGESGMKRHDEGHTQKQAQSC